MVLGILIIENIKEREKEPQFLSSQVIVKGSEPGLTIQGIIYYTNTARQEIEGLPPLKENSLLNKVASERLADLFKNQYFAHQSPTGESVTDVASRIGYHYKVLAENIGLGLNSDEKMVRGWLQSPSHRENILRSECAEIGVAVGRGFMKKRWVWMGVQVFGLQAPPVQGKALPGTRETIPSPSRLCLPPDAQLFISIQEMKNRLSELDETEQKLRQELDESNPFSAGPETDRIKDREAISIYNKKVAQYNLVVRDIQAKMEQYSQTVTRYNAQVSNYNICLKRESTPPHP